MKTSNLFFLSSVLIFSFYANGESCSTAIDTEKQEISSEPRAALKDTFILVVRGTPDNFDVIGAMPSNEFKVVPRRKEVLVTKQTISCQNNSKAPNRVSLLGGYGSQGGLRQNRADAPDRVEVESRVGFVGGAQYQWLATETVSLGVQVLSSETGLFIFGKDF